jgi:hypothetical protein
MRSVTFREAIELLCERTSGEHRTIVETGCVRERNDYSAGYSTVIFAGLVERYGGRVHTVDLSARNMALCRRVTRRWSHRISYNVGDSAEYLRAWPAASGGRAIDLLYLDSWDYPLEGAGAAARAASQQHCLAELEAALPSLREGSLVLIDDGDLPGGGKPLLAKRRLAELGWTCLIDAYQTLWSVPPVTAPGPSRGLPDASSADPADVSSAGLPDLSSEGLPRGKSGEPPDVSPVSVPEESSAAKPEASRAVPGELAADALDLPAEIG